MRDTNHESELLGLGASTAAVAKRGLNPEGVVMKAIGKQPAPVGPADRNKLRFPGIARVVWHMLLPHERARCGLLFAVMLLGAGLEMATLAAIQVYMNLVASGSLSAVDWLDGMATQEQLLVLSGVLIAAFAIKFFFFVGLFAFMSWTVTQQRVSFSMRLFEAYQAAPYEWHLAQNTSEMQRNLTQDMTLVTQGVVLQLLQFLLNLMISIAIAVFIVISLPPVLLSALLVVLVLLMLGTSFAHKVLAAAGTERRASAGAMLHTIREGLGALTEARILGRTPWFARRFKRALSQSAGAQRRIILVQQSVPIGIEALTLSSLMLIVALVVALSDSLQSALALSTVLAAAIFRLKQSVNKLANAANKMSEASPSLWPLVEDLETLRPHLSQTDTWSASDRSRSRVETVSFENVSYRFPGKEAPALEGISLTICRGEHVALVGQTGAGKSTFLGLLLGLLSPTEGRIAVNGTSVDQVISQWRRSIGYVPQAVFVIDDTIAANVAFGVPENSRDRERIRAALRVAQLGNFVDGLPDGIETRVAEDGSALSGGQRQRMGIARALYHQPDVIILDEATSALDRSTQDALLAAIAELEHRPTIVSVTHNVELLHFSHRIIVLDAGRMAAVGDYDTLVRDSGRFREIARLDPAV